ncbi:MAG: hypothetical protein GY842_22895 [bacterium]|nr:hypothetical protein [bacterium]
MSEVADILESCRRVVAHAAHLTVDSDAVHRRAGLIDPGAIPSPEHPAELRIRGTRPEQANFVLLADCLNFCFWSDQPWEINFAGQTWRRTFAMLAGLVRAIQADRSWLSAERWAAADVSELEAVFSGVGRIPLLERRVEVLRETGAVLLQRYAGDFANLVEQASTDAVAIADLLARDFPSFRDAAEYAGHPVAFLKRAQICAADLASQWAAEQQGTLEGLDRLTVFADYRLPQLFRHWKLLLLSDPLAERIAALEEIAAGSPEEIEVRAATICIGDELASALDIPAWRLDYYLWVRSHDAEVVVPHHRTRTIYY